MAVAIDGREGKGVKVGDEVTVTDMSTVDGGNMLKQNDLVPGCLIVVLCRLDLKGVTKKN